MKNCVVVLLTVLGLSAAASAGLKADVSVCPTCPTCESDVNLKVVAEVPGRVFVDDIARCVQGGVISVTIFLGSNSCEGCTSLNREVNVGKLCPGLYIAFVKIVCIPPECDCGDCPFDCFNVPRLCAIGATSFKVTCNGCDD